jgi:exonuclease 3'-5' domain-containing protein 1
MDAPSPLRANVMPFVPAGHNYYIEPTRAIGQTFLGDFIQPCKEPENILDTNGVQFAYITEDGEELEKALQLIGQSHLIAVDCEGLNMSRAGELCMVQVATADQVYLFDVISLGDKLFSKGLKRILERTIPTKVFYDCRKDSDILYHQFGVKLKGVLDAALTEVYFRWNNNMGVPRFLKGYKRSVETYLMITDPRFYQLKDQICNQMTVEGSSLWKERPLSKDALEYAAYDVKYLRLLHTVLTERMSKRNIRMIYGASTRFVRMERDLNDLSGRDTTQWTVIQPEWFTLN